MSPNLKGKSAMLALLLMAMMNFAMEKDDTDGNEDFEKAEPPLPNCQDIMPLMRSNTQNTFAGNPYDRIHLKLKCLASETALKFITDIFHDNWKLENELENDIQGNGDLINDHQHHTENQKSNEGDDKTSQNSILSTTENYFTNSMEEWTVNQVFCWAQENHLKELFESVQENKITGEILVKDLDKKSLLYLLLRKISEIKNSQKLSKDPVKYPKSFGIYNEEPVKKYEQDFPTEAAYEICVVCCKEMTESKDIFITACFHKYHSNCILKWAIEFGNETCPICRSPSLSAKKKGKGKKLLKIYEETTPRENANFPRKLTYNGEIGHNLTYPDELVQKQLSFSNKDTMKPKRTASQQRQRGSSHQSKENPRKESKNLHKQKREDEKQRKIEEKNKKEFEKHLGKKEEKRILAEEEVTQMLLGEERKEIIDNLCLKFERQILTAAKMNEDQKQNALNKMMGLIAKSNNSIQKIVFEKWKSNAQKLVNAERKSQIEDAQKKEKQMQQKLNKKNNVIIQITKYKYDNNIKKLVFDNWRKEKDLIIAEKAKIKEQILMDQKKKRIKQLFNTQKLKKAEKKAKIQGLETKKEENQENGEAKDIIKMVVESEICESAEKLNIANEEKDENEGNQIRETMKNITEENKNSKSDIINSSNSISSSSDQNSFQTPENLSNPNSNLNQNSDTYFQSSSNDLFNPNYSFHIQASSIFDNWNNFNFMPVRTDFNSLFTNPRYVTNHQYNGATNHQYDINQNFNPFLSNILVKNFADSYPITYCNILNRNSGYQNQKNLSNVSSELILSPRSKQQKNENNVDLCKYNISNNYRRKKEDSSFLTLACNGFIENEYEEKRKKEAERKRQEDKRDKELKEKRRKEEENIIQAVKEAEQKRLEEARKKTEEEKRKKEAERKRQEDKGDKELKEKRRKEEENMTDENNNLNQISSYNTNSLQNQDQGKQFVFDSTTLISFIIMGGIVKVRGLYERKTTTLDGKALYKNRRTGCEISWNSVNKGWYLCNSKGYGLYCNLENTDTPDKHGWEHVNFGISNCPGAHGLEKFTLKRRRREFDCECCGNKITKTMIQYGCHVCKYHLCKHCYASMSTGKHNIVCYQYDEWLRYKTRGKKKKKKM